MGSAHMPAEVRESIDFISTRSPLHEDRRNFWQARRTPAASRARLGLYDCVCELGGALSRRRADSIAQSASLGVRDMRRSRGL